MAKIRFAKDLIKLRESANNIIEDTQEEEVTPEVETTVDFASIALEASNKLNVQPEESKAAPLSAAQDSELVFIPMNRDTVLKYKLPLKLATISKEITGRIMATKGGEMIGYGYLDDGYVSCVKIEPQFRNKGYGVVLMNELMKNFKGDMQRVSKFDKDTLNLYDDAGMIRAKQTIDDYYLVNDKRATKLTLEEAASTRVVYDTIRVYVDNRIDGGGWSQELRVKNGSINDTVRDYKNSLGYGYYVNYLGPGKTHVLSAEKKKLCPECGTPLNDAGECPVCDLGDESMLGESVIEDSKKRIEDILGMSYDEAVAEVKQMIESKIMWEFNINITGVEFTGSWRFGSPRRTSDLDVVMTYESNGRRVREDDLFNFLHDRDNKMYFGGYVDDYLLDISPVEDGDMESILDDDSKFRKDRSKALREDTRATIVNKSRGVGEYKDKSRGKNRFERRKHVKPAGTVKEYNNMNMNVLFSQDILQVDIPVVGETNTYTVTLKMEGVVAEIAKLLKSNSNKFEFKVVIQALSNRFNMSDVYTRCTCPDFKYNFAHWNIVHGVSVDDTAHDPGPGKNVANPNDDKGRGCKHILQILNNGDWLMKVASVITNYCNWAEEKLMKPFQNIIFPKLFNTSVEEAATAGLVQEGTDLLTDKHALETIADWAKNRGKFQKGSNKNPVAAEKEQKAQAAQQAKEAPKAAEPAKKEPEPQKTQAAQPAGQAAEEDAKKAPANAQEAQDAGTK